jgi:hypothetical protein
MPITDFVDTSRPHNTTNRIRLCEMKRCWKAVLGGGIHYGKRLRVIAILEKSEGGRWHYHAAIEPPTFIDHIAFGELAMKTWSETDSGYGYGDVCLNANSGWITYMTKRRTKSPFEHYFDCIDTDAFYNPAASA